VRIIEWHLETSTQGCGRSDTVEVEDSATDEEIDEIVREEVFNFISWGWAEKAKV
jgi:hypothetical protein